MAQRELEGPPNPLALSEIISNALPPDISCGLKKELKPNDYMVRYHLVFALRQFNILLFVLRI